VAVPSTIHCDHLIQVTNITSLIHKYNCLPLQAQIEGTADLARAKDINKEVTDNIVNISSIAAAGLQLPGHIGRQVRRRLLEAGQRHHPPDHPRELRFPRSVPLKKLFSL
jgi:hypothetical protein